MGPLQFFNDYGRNRSDLFLASYALLYNSNTLHLSKKVTNPLGHLQCLLLLAYYRMLYLVFLYLTYGFSLNGGS